MNLRNDLNGMITKEWSQGNDYKEMILREWSQGNELKGMITRDFMLMRRNMKKELKGIEKENKLQDEKWKQKKVKK